MNGRMRVLLHVVAAIGGGYALTAAAVPLAAVLLASAGLARSEATALAMMLGFVFYAVLLLCAFGERSLARLCAVLATATAASAALLLSIR